MGALLPLRKGVPPNLPEPFAGTFPTDGPDRPSYGGDFSAGRARPAGSRPAIGGSLSARGNLRARLADGDRAAGGPTRPAAGEILSASGEPPAGASPGTRTALVVHLSVLSRSGRYQPRGGAGDPRDGDCAQGVGRQPHLGGSAHPADPGQRAAHLRATRQGRLRALGLVVALAASRNLGHCAWRLTRATAESVPPTTIPKVVTFCGRTFSAPELELMRQTAAEFAALGVTEISGTVCERWEWKRPNGKLKNHECRQLLEQLQAEGVLTLPALRNLGGRGPRRMDISRPGFQPAPLECAVSECEPLELALVEGRAESRLWREHVERYHYLGCHVPFGANLRYWVRNRDRELACLLWTSPAWKMKPRDAWIGWSDEQRQRHLQEIVNNGRFLILPWVRVKGLASKILALNARHLPHDWQTRYGHRPLLLETLVDAQRFRGT